MVERQTENLEVRGSNPFIGIIYNNKNPIYALLCLKLIENKTTKTTDTCLVSKVFNYASLIWKTKIKKYSLSTKITSFFSDPYAHLKKVNVFRAKNRRKLKQKYLKHKINKKQVQALALANSLSHADTADNFYLGPQLAFLQSWLLSKYVGELINIYIGFYPEWIFLNMKELTGNTRFNLICRAVNKRRILGSFYHENKMLFRNWFGKLTYLKDPNSLTSLIKTVMSKTHLKKHRILFFILNRVIKTWFFYTHEKNHVLGYSFFFKGKLGKKGSVKKTKFFRKYGITSFTNKSVRVNHKEFFVITITGVVGGGLTIYFK